MKAYAVMLQSSQSYMVSAKLEHCTACCSFLAVLAIYRRQRI
jgi:hypothetical protein